MLPQAKTSLNEQAFMTSDDDHKRFMVSVSRSGWNPTIPKQANMSSSVLEGIPCSQLETSEVASAETLKAAHLRRTFNLVDDCAQKMKLDRSQVLKHLLNFGVTKQQPSDDKSVLPISPAATTVISQQREALAPPHENLLVLDDFEASQRQWAADCTNLREKKRNFQEAGRRLYHSVAPERAHDQQALTCSSPGHERTLNESGAHGRNQEFVDNSSCFIILAAFFMTLPTLQPDTSIELPVMPLLVSLCIGILLGSVQVVLNVSE